MPPGGYKRSKDLDESGNMAPELERNISSDVPSMARHPSSDIPGQDLPLGVLLRAPVLTQHIIMLLPGMDRKASLLLPGRKVSVVDGGQVAAFREPSAMRALFRCECVCGAGVLLVRCRITRVARGGMQTQCAFGADSVCACGCSWAAPRRACSRRQSRASTAGTTSRGTLSSHAEREREMRR